MGNYNNLQILSRNIKKYKILGNILIAALLFASCQAYHPFHKYNQFQGSTVYNDSLEVSIKYFGDIEFTPLDKLPKKIINRKIEDIPEVKINNLLVYGATNDIPEYNVLLFFEKKEKRRPGAQDTIRLIMEDPVNHRVLYKNRNGKKVAYFLLEGKNDNRSMSSIINDGLTLSKSISFNITSNPEITYSQVFQQYKNYNNYLLVREKLENAPVSKSQHNEWMRFQFLATINSFMSDNKDYDLLIKRFETTRKDRLRPILDSVLTSPRIITNDSVAEHIANLSSNTRVVMLNENHWYPKHRKFALMLLKGLKHHGYTHLAIEALYKNEEKFINQMNFPTFYSGYYTREPFFGHLIRKAKELGFKVIDYESTNGENRELRQAKNLISVLHDNPTAKIFVYAGLDHIIEEETEEGKRMATYLKELTNIDPLTINQVDLVSDNTYQLVMIPYNKINTTVGLTKEVDYFVINNLEVNYTHIYPKDEIKKTKIKGDFLDNFKQEDLLVSVYNKDEYSEYKMKSVPIIARIINNINNNYFYLSLPRGSFVVVISTVENDQMFITEITVS